MSAECYFDRVTKFEIDAMLTSPMHVGSGDANGGVLIHDVTLEPFIQGTSIAGAFREYYESIWGSEADELFGQATDTDKKSRLKFEDGSFVDLGMEIRPRLKINPETGSCSSSIIKGTNSVSGHKFDMEYIGTGSKIHFNIYFLEEIKEGKIFKEHLLETLKALDTGNILLGGQKSNGCGEVKIINLSEAVYDMTNKKDQMAWVTEEKKGKKVSLKDIRENTTSSYKISFKGYLPKVLVKGIADKRFSDQSTGPENIKNANGECIIPGSSLKGVFRNRMELIARYINREDLIYNAFGIDSESIGNIRFTDTIIGNKEENESASIDHRIHIDKFTGGIIDGALFSEKNSFGKIDMKIEISSNNDPEGTLGLLLFALRDMALGEVCIGSGSSVGKGYINPESITVTSLKRSIASKIIFENGEMIIEDEEKIIDKGLKSLEGVS